MYLWRTLRFEDTTIIAPTSTQGVMRKQMIAVLTCFRTLNGLRLYTIHGNLTGVCGRGGSFQQKEGEIGGHGLGTQPPNHRSDLATMIRGVVGQMLHEVR